MLYTYCLIKMQMRRVLERVETVHYVNLYLDIRYAIFILSISFFTLQIKSRNSE